MQPICDGSEGPRLVYASIAGFGSVGDVFTAANGSNYLVVTGACDYFLSDSTLRGLRVGQLTQEDADRWAAELHFGRYSSASDYSSTGLCADAGLRVLVDNTGRLSNDGCGHEPDAPKVWSEAFDQVWRLFMQLADQAEPAWDATRLLAVRDPDPLSTDTIFDWRGDIDLDEYAVDPLELARNVELPPGLLVQDATALAVLSELRLAALTTNTFASELYVEDPMGRRYQVLLRDELPDSVSEVLRDALQLP